jgi:hypothetical protein
MVESAEEKGYVNYMPCYASVGHFMERESLTSILKELIVLSALPLKSVETNFAVDSSGFRTTKFMEYCKIKHHTKSEHEWIKAHICCGVKTNIITAVDIGDEWSGDTNRLIPLVEDTRNSGFLINEVSADKAYSSRNNLKKLYLPFWLFKNQLVFSSAQQSRDYLLPLLNKALNQKITIPFYDVKRIYDDFESQNRVWGFGFMKRPDAISSGQVFGEIASDDPLVQQLENSSKSFCAISLPFKEGEVKIAVYAVGTIVIHKNWAKMNNYRTNLKVIQDKLKPYEVSTQK